MNTTDSSSCSPTASMLPGWTKPGAPAQTAPATPQHKDSSTGSRVKTPAIVGPQAQRGAVEGLGVTSFTWSLGTGSSQIAATGDPERPDVVFKAGPKEQEHPGRAAHTKIKGIARRSHRLQGLLSQTIPPPPGPLHSWPVPAFTSLPCRNIVSNP